MANGNQTPTERLKQRGQSVEALTNQLIQRKTGITPQKGEDAISALTRGLSNQMQGQQQAGATNITEQQQTDTSDITQTQQKTERTRQTDTTQQNQFSGFENADEMIDEARQQGMTDTEILNTFSKNKPEFAPLIEEARQKGDNDRKILNRFSKNMAGELPSEPSVPVDQQQTQEGGEQDDNLLGRASDVFGSGLQAATDVVTGVAKKFGSTAKGAAQLGEQALETVTGVESAVSPGEETSAQQLQTKTEQAIGVEEGDLTTSQNTAEKIGFFGGNLAEFVVPGAKISKLGKGAGLLSRVAGEAGVGAGVATLQEGEVDEETIGQEVALGALAGSAVPAARGAKELAGELLGNTAKTIAGLGTGEGADTIEAIVKNPESAEQAIKEVGEDEIKAMKKTANKLTSSVKDVQRQSREEYGKMLDKLPDAEVIDGGESAVLNAEDGKFLLSKGELRQRAKDVLSNKWGVNITDEGLEFTSQSPFVKDSEQRAIRNAWEQIDNLDSPKPKNINQLATNLLKLKKPGEGFKQLRSAVTDIKRQVRGYISDKIPRIREVNESFGQTEEFLEAMERRLKVPTEGRPSKDDLISISKKIGTLFSSNKEMSRQLVRELEDQIGEEIIGRAAGQKVTGGISRSTANIGGSLQSILSVIPDRVFAKGATTVGKATKALENIPNRIKKDIADQTDVSKEKVDSAFKKLSEMDLSERGLIFSMFADTGAEQQQEQQLEELQPKEDSGFADKVLGQ